MQLSDFLIKAKAVISEESKWTQGFYAKASDGTFVESKSEKATCHCSLGAIEKVSGPDISWQNRALVRDAEKALSKAMGGGEVAAFNDSKTHEEVMKAWDLAIVTAITEESLK